MLWTELQATRRLQRIRRAQTMAHPYRCGRLDNITIEFDPDEVGARKKCIISTEGCQIIVLHWTYATLQP
jgi:hypothetical protein